jgi:hypothetical protein
MSFPYDSSEATTVRSLYTKLRKFYTPNGLAVTANMTTLFPSVNKTTLISQQIDSYGKARGFVIEFKHEGEMKRATIFTTPIQPLQLIERDEIIPIHASLAIDLMAQLMVKGSSQTVAHEKIIEMSGMMGNIQITIPIIADHRKVKGLKEKIGVGYPLSDSSRLVTFSRNKKIAQCLSEMLVHNFSKFLNGSLPHADSVDKFFEKQVLLDETFSYDGIVPSKIFKNLTGFIKKNKLIVSSEEMRKRLRYTLQLALTRNEAKVIACKDRLFIENYYTTASDFDKHPTQTILEGSASIEEWLVSDEKVMMIDGPSFTSKIYFFRNSLISEKIFLAQHTSSLQKASEIASAWKTNGYNIGKQASGMSAIQNLSLFSYADPSSIRKFKVNGLPSDSGEYLKIMGYKRGGVAQYVVLMEIS